MKPKFTPGLKTPFPFSVGFPLSIRPQVDSIAVCGANRGEGWPILCEVPRNNPDAEGDARAIADACTAVVDLWADPKRAALIAAAPELLAALLETTEALKEARRFVLLSDDKGFAAYNETGKVQLKARELIAKAEGLA